MTIETRTRIIPLHEIIIPPERQRSDSPDTEDLKELADSIIAYGLLHPIILEKVGEEKHLVVGWRRYHAWKSLAEMSLDPYKKGIPARYISDLSPVERHAVELEENIQRKQLDWRDEAKSYADYYDLQNIAWHEELKDSEDYNPEDDVSYAFIGGKLGVSTRHARRMTVVGRKVHDNDKEVLACDSSRAAASLLDRRMKRAADIELTTFDGVETVEDPAVANVEITDLDLETASPAAEPQAVVNYEILRLNFNEWVQSTVKAGFNFVHCDFPYGIGIDRSEQANTESKDGKLSEDSDEVYWNLCNSLLVARKKGILSKSCHIMFWFPMSKYSETLGFFTAHDFRVDPYPLIWMKSDKMGILPDPARGPRRIYETAFLMSLGDRKIIKPTVNGAHYDSKRRSDSAHVSSKPSLMLSDFFRMFIDSDSVVLDPTCGSGTALETSIRMHCKSALGLDTDEKSVEISNELCQSAYNLIIKGAN